MSLLVLGEKLWHDPNMNYLRPSLICLIYVRPWPSLAPVKNQKHMPLALSGPNLVLVEWFEQLYD